MALSCRIILRSTVGGATLRGMRRVVVMLGLMLLAGACGESTQDGDGLHGIWRLSVPPSCVLDLSFLDGGVYTKTFTCPLPDIGWGSEEELGSYQTSAGNITFTAEKATCPQTPNVTSRRYNLSPASLELVSDTESVVFTKHIGVGGEFGSAGRCEGRSGSCSRRRPSPSYRFRADGPADCQGRLRGHSCAGLRIERARGAYAGRDAGVVLLSLRHRSHSQHAAMAPKHFCAWADSGRQHPLPSRWYGRK